MTTLSFDNGTAYDFFISLVVLHYPGDFGLRPSWAAGVRSRLPAEQREFLEHCLSYFSAPLCWLQQLPAQPKDSSAALRALEAVPPAQRLPALTFACHLPPELRQALSEIAASGQASRAQREVLRAELQRKKHPPRAETLEHFIRAWSDPALLGTGRE